MNKLRLLSLIITGTLLFACSPAEAPMSITSPDGSLRLTTSVDDGILTYELTRDGSPLLTPGRLGLLLREVDFTEGLSLLGSETDTFDETWEQVWGEEVQVRNHYNELTLHLKKADEDKYLDLIFRLFDDGLGFRYAFPKKGVLDSITILDERTQFAFAQDYQAWSMPTHTTEFYEGLFTREPLSKKDTICTPVTLEGGADLFMALHQANLTDYASMNVFPVATNGEGTTLQADLVPWSTGEKVFAQVPFMTPWRTLIVTRSAGDLALSRLMLNLNDPCKIDDTGWIRTGKYVGIWWAMHLEKATWYYGPKHGATTEHTKQYIDFAAEHGFESVLVEGWNKGWEDNWADDIDMFSYTESYPDYDLPELAKYAQEKGVTLIAHNETGGQAANYEEQMEEAFALYQSLGIHSIKTGYVNGLMDGKENQHSQYGIRHYRKVVETAAKYQIMVDNHEPAMPTGLQRTYPNLMTHEGLRGQEYNAWDKRGGNPPYHACILPFTRGLAGPMDYTPGIFDYANPAHPGTHPQHTRAKELALYVVLYSPLQMAADLIENYDGHPEFAFITACPTNWSKTVYPSVELGKQVTVARQDRESDEWFLGAVTDEDARTVSITLDFLTPDVVYKAILYRDTAESDYETNPYAIDIEERELSSTDTITLDLARSGGAAIRFIPLS